MMAAELRQVVMGLSTNTYLIIGLLAIIALGLLFPSALQKPNSRKSSAPGKLQPSAKTPSAKTPSAKTPSTKTPPVAKNPYRATSIVAGPDACEAVKGLQNKRFLVANKDIPQIPVPNCDEPRCTCKYAHHPDRREEGDDRRGPTGLRTELHKHIAEAERRAKKRGRRKSDWE